MACQGLLKVNILTMLLYTYWVEGTGSFKPLTHMKPVGHIIHTVQLTLSADTPGGVLLTTGLQTYRYTKCVHLESSQKNNGLRDSLYTIFSCSKKK